MAVIRFLFCLFSKCVLSLRYRVEVEGLEELRGMTKAIILPNHPAYMDPPIVLQRTWSVLKPRPMLFGGLFENPFLFWIPKVMNAVYVPALEQHSSAARQQAEKAIDAMVAGLENGDNHILWPSGQTWRRGGFEDLGSARSLTEILRRVPDANIIAVRTRGLWGSSFSYARRAGSPPLIANLIKGFFILLANFVFFAPRRKVHIRFEHIDRADLPEMVREKINLFFDDWYNALGAEEPSFVPYHPIFGPRTFEFPTLESGSEVDAKKITADTKAAIADMFHEKFAREIEVEQNVARMKLANLGLDSLDSMELSLAIEDRFGFASENVPTTLGDLWMLAQGLLDTAPTKPAPPQWFNEIGGPMEILADTIGEAFVRRALHCKADVAAADDMSGAVTYERMLVGAIAMSKRFEKIDAPNVGLMLPASVATDLTFMALHLAGKLPVVLNWTTGPGNLAHAAKTMGLSHVVTSHRFVDRTGVSVEGAEFMFLEDVKKGMGKLELLLTLLRVRILGGAILSGLPDVKPDGNAVVLFTSGSEKAPKAVPLTHANILCNIRSALASIDLQRSDTILGFLPAFHSFGLTVTSVLPVLGGMRVVHHPDPTDAGALVRKIADYKATIVCGTPTFVNYIIDRAKPDDLQSLKLVVVGAEKCPESVFDRFEKIAPQARIIEGYGITECAPLISVNRVHDIRKGTIGQPLSGVDVRVVDPDSMEPLSRGEQGMLLVNGPNVFHGYIGDDVPVPFHDHDGKRWYITGDLARMDEDGVIEFSGRLKRFLKAGGEMISLPALEEPFSVAHPPDEDGPRVAVEGIETDHGRRIVLFSIDEISLRDANALLMESGFRGVMRLDDVQKVDAIPVLGTGKTDYKVLRKWVESPEEVRMSTLP